MIAETGRFAPSLPVAPAALMMAAIHATRERGHDMREIIDGTLYDTDNATEIDTWHNGKPKGDFKRIERTLYHTENGSWFEVVNGGAMTKFSKSVPTGGKAGDTVLRPLTEDRAFQWMEKFSDVATAFEYFEDRIDVA